MPFPKTSLGASLIAVLILAVGSSTYSQVDRKTSIGILFDNTGSMRPLIEVQREFARLVVEKAPENSVFSIFGFATDPNRGAYARFAAGIECSSDQTAIKNQIGAIPIVPGQTTLIDAIASGLDRLKKSSLSGCDKSDERLMVVISDGEDRASTTSPKDLFAKLESAGIRVFVIAVLRDLSKDAGFIMKSPLDRSKGFLMKVASDSGGRIVILKKKETPQELVEQLFAENYVFPK